MMARRVFGVQHGAHAMLRLALLRVAGMAIAGVLLALLAVRVAAQIPYHVFDDRTEVASIDFHFTTTESFPVSRLKDEMVLSERGALAGVRETLSFLPIVSDPAAHPFSPLELQRDIARLRQFYEAAGFIGTRISYEVQYDNDDNEVDIDIVIEEGRPITLRSVDIALVDGDDPEDQLPEDLKPVWRGFVERGDEAIGERFTAAERVRIVSAVLDWWMNRGWAFARARTETSIDSAEAAQALRVALDPGPRARIDSVEVVGNESVSRDLILRTLPFREGDWFSAAELAEAQRRLFGLELFRLALAEVPRDQQRDSTVRVLIRLQESPPRLVTGELGYVSAGGGITGRAQFAHRNFTGGARTLRVTALAQTGEFAFVERPEREYQFSVSYREPFLFRPQLSFSVAPFGQYRDNLTDRSWQVGIESTLIYELGQYRFITLRHRYSARRVLDYRIGSGSAIDLAALLRLAAEGALDEIGPRIDRSTFSLSGTVGRFDPTRPTDALQVNPSIEVTAPSTLNTIEYAHIELPLTAYYPITGRIAIAGRARFGRVFPFGKTVRGDSVGPIEEIQLRDVLLNAGGTGSVRGWANALVGPKLLNLRFEDVPGTDSIVATGTDGYIPAGGLARASASVEMRLPFPGLGPSWGTHVFLDAGRVWTPDDRFQPGDPNEERRWFYAAGAGVDLNTLVGPIRLSMGYKLNPSVLDERDADDVFDAISNGLPITSVPPDWKKRLHVHISLGQVF